MADVIQVKPSARIQLKKNSGVVIYDQQFAPVAATYTSHLGQSVLVATNTSAALSVGGIATVRNMLVQSDQPVNIKINGQSGSVPLVGTNSVWAAYSTSVTAIKVFNNSTTNTATIQYIVTN